ncbi:Zn-ribbon domain-containing OB-fold protein [[Mycobacterium] nativiensis]|uniref:OB-fold domain-containing protein n=1 Tax=[Mycobacterium] nativiensis TaxID=2855503 RepID=A0ABU5XV65_9MYCO|nr:OB-fold domain-containing protein [Mycolicibacter sp. MYC340]MEB3031877.1 OB-fold domain-containing protein [Mycolicibacter sp. MYC340]
MTSVPPLIRTRDNDFFFAAAAAGRLEIQRCAACKVLRHPPGPACPACRSFDWDTVVSSRRATLHSWTVVHHPRDPAFDYPLAVGLVDLAEGVRLVADIAEVDLATLAIDMELEVGFAEHGRGEILPRLFPPGQARGAAR